MATGISNNDNLSAEALKKEGPLSASYDRLERFLFSHRHGQGKTSWLGAFAVAAALVCGIATYAALTETKDLGKNANLVIWLLNIDLVVLLFLMVLVVRRIAGLFSGRRKGVAGSKLHVRLVFIFSILAAAPAILMTIFSAVFLHVGYQAGSTSASTQPSWNRKRSPKRILKNTNR